MTPGIFASSVAILGIGLVLAPVAASARGGGVAAGRAFSVRGGISPRITSPGIMRPGVPVMRPAVGGASGVGSLHATGAVMHIHNFHTAWLRHRHPFRHDWSLTGGGWYGGSYDAATYAVPYDPSSFPASMTDDVAAATEQAIPVRRVGCSSQTKMVPSEAGGERAITIVRC